MTDDEEQSGHGIFQELVRRRVFRAAGAYIVASWVLVQVASIIFPEFNAPDWAMRALIVMLIAGFPFAMLLAWTLDITRKGIARTAPTKFSARHERGIRASILATTTVLSVGALWWFWASFVQPSTERPAPSIAKSNPVVAVAAPNMLAGGDDIAWLGQGVATLVRNNLAESPHVVVLSDSGWNRIGGDAADEVPVADLARDAGIDYLVDGDYLQTPDGIVMTIRVEDLENGIEIQGLRLEEADPAALFAAASQISVRLRRALQIPLQETVERFNADFVANNMDAYEAYVAGLGFLVDFDYEAAEASFEAALSLSPEYHMARLRLADALEATGRTELAWETLNEIPADNSLSERERLYVEGMKAFYIHQRDNERAIEIFGQLAEFIYDYVLSSKALAVLGLSLAEEKLTLGDALGRATGRVGEAVQADVVSRLMDKAFEALQGLTT